MHFRKSSLGTSKISVMLNLASGSILSLLILLVFKNKQVGEI